MLLMRVPSPLRQSVSIHAATIVSSPMTAVICTASVQLIAIDIVPAVAADPVVFSFTSRVLTRVAMLLIGSRR